jgi:lipopolysaccharide biosynthesis regulator YciM
MLNRMDKGHAARSLMQQAYKQGQNRGRAAFDLGYMNLRYGDYDGAITAFEEAIQRRYVLAIHSCIAVMPMLQSARTAWPNETISQHSRVRTNGCRLI